MSLPKQIVKLRIVDYEKLSYDQINNQFDRLDDMLDRVHKRFDNERYSFNLLKQYFSVILNMYYMVKEIDKRDPDMEGAVRMQQQLKELKKKLDIL